MPSSITPALLAPLKVGQHTLNHRVVLAPMTRLRASFEGVVSDLDALYHQQRTTKGGLLITGASRISASAGGFPCVPGIFTDEQINAWKKVTSAVHEKEGVIFLQIVHLGRATAGVCLLEGEQAVSASDIPIQGLSLAGVPYETPRALTVDEIKSIAQDFAKAAKNAVEAGFDGVELHGANGFLLDQFINTSSNKRTDDYGGSIENRARFVIEVVDAVSQAIGDQKTAIRFSPYSGYQDMKDDSPVETWSYITSELEKKHPGLAYIHFIEPRVTLESDGPAEADDKSLDPFRSRWSGPFIASGNYTYSIKDAHEYAESSSNNLVAFGRAFVANPDLVDRIKNNWKLNPYNRNTFYSPGPEGYVDYTFYNDTQ